MCHRSALFPLSENFGHWKDFSVSLLYKFLHFFKRCPSHSDWNSSCTPEHNYPLEAQLSPLTLSFLEISQRISAALTANSARISVFHRRIELIRGAGSRLEQSEGSDISVFQSVCLSVSVVSPSRFTQIVRPELLWPSLGCSNNIIQLSFYPQAMNNLWIVNQRRGVSSLDWMGPQGLRWRETKPAPFHPLLVQIKIKVVLKGPACAQVIWGPVEKNPRENTTLIPIHVLTDRQIKNVFPSQAHPVSLNLATGCTRCDETQQSSSVKDGPVESVCV